MIRKRRATILGCGSSAGVPRVGQGWGACDPSNPKNRRRRCSVLIEQFAESGAKTAVLIDTSPDLRDQCLSSGIDRLDAILLTHSHADHIHGIDDIRPLVQKSQRRIDIYMDEATSAIVRPRFDYIFETPPGSFYEPLLNERRLRLGEACVVDGPGGPIEFWPFRLEHGEIDALGFRIGDAAYAPDLKRVPEKSEAYMLGLEILIIDALRPSLHPSHLCVQEALDYIRRFAPREALLTDLSTELDYAQLSAQAPPNVAVAFDGLQIELPQGNWRPAPDLKPD